MKRLLTLFTFALMLALPAYSQVMNETPRFDVGGGYQRNTGDIGLNGWFATGAYRASPWLGLAADFSGTYGSDEVLGVNFKSNLHNFVFGPRVFVPLNNHPNWKPFGELLLGFSRVNETIESSVVAPGIVVPGIDQTDTAFSWMLGGGLDYQFREDFRVRVIQLDLLRTNFFDTGQSRARIGFGLIYQFKR